MAEHFKVPIRDVRGEKWGALAYLHQTHEICGEDVRSINDRFTFAGNHRVKLFRFKKNVYWRIPKEIIADISQVQPEIAPRRQR
jgi:hypothetical protein